MADTKISSFASGAPALGTDEFVIARGGSNLKLTTTDIATFVGAVSLATTDLTDVDAASPTLTGQILIFNSVSGNYEPSLILDGGTF